MSNGVDIKELRDYTDNLLDASRFRDYCPNGLQVEGRAQVHRIITGVTASMAVLEHAIQLGGDVVLVHHGYFWKGESPEITGIKKQRLSLLLRHDINLLAYHLPLDAHPELGNNIQLAQRLGLNVSGWFGDQGIAVHGHWLPGLSLAELAHQVATTLQREPLVIGDLAAPVRRMALCSGAAQDLLEEAVSLGMDVFLTGEVSERTVHLARESGVAFIAAGHHASERYGVQALGQHLAERFGLFCEFVDVDNPV